MNELSAQFWNLAEPEHFRVRAYCRKLTGSRDDGDDLYQDALVKAMTSFGSLKSKDSFRPWLYRIVINRYKNRVRRPFWKRFLPMTSEIAETIPESGMNPSIARRRLEIAFGAVTPDEKGLIALFEMHGWTVSELSEMTGLSEGAVKVRLCRIRKKMRTALSRYLNESVEGKLWKKILSEDEICVVTKPDKN